MPNRSQRHKQAANFVPPSPPPVSPPPTIVITALDPNTAPRNTSGLHVAVTGTALQPGDTIVWNSGSVSTNYIWAGQVTTDAVATGSVAKTVQVHLARGAEVSNELPFTVT